MNAIVEFSKLNRTCVAPYNTIYDAKVDYKGIIEGGNVGSGIGCALDVISGQGVDFSRIPFGIQMELNLTEDFPNALYLFVHSKQTLVMNEQSVQVIN